MVNNHLDPSTIAEIAPGDLWNPRSFDEWEGRERLRTFLPAWSAQSEHERSLRGKCTWMIFALALLQTVGGFALLTGLGLRYLVLSDSVISVIFVGLMAEIFGLFALVVRYLFNQPIKYAFGALRDEVTDVDRPA